VAQLRASLDAVAQAGAFGVVLEMIPSEVMTLLQKETSLLTIGIGAGQACDGQILVLDDLIGRHPSDFKYPRFSPPWIHTGHLMQEALKQYQTKTTMKLFPDASHIF
jgi:3-methyl-2-oxobutanoate hydroxymethyltransferase